MSLHSVNMLLLELLLLLLLLFLILQPLWCCQELLLLFCGFASTFSNHFDVDVVAIVVLAVVAASLMLLELLLLLHLVLLMLLSLPTLEFTYHVKVPAIERSRSSMRSMLHHHARNNAHTAPM